MVAIFPVPMLRDGREAEISSPYGDERRKGPHRGVDITYRRLRGEDPLLGGVGGFQRFAVPPGTPVLATEAGTVIRAGKAGPGRQDEFIALLHDATGPDGANSTVYVHLEPGSVRHQVGRRVLAGEPIGVIGPAPNSARHLHLDRRAGASYATRGIQVDPAPYLATAIHTRSTALPWLIAAGLSALGGLLLGAWKRISQ